MVGFTAQPGGHRIAAAQPGTGDQPQGKAEKTPVALQVQWGATRVQAA